MVYITCIPKQITLDELQTEHTELYPIRSPNIREFLLDFYSCLRMTEYEPSHFLLWHFGCTYQIIGNYQ